jgi:hypothetical protein
MTAVSFVLGKTLYGKHCLAIVTEYQPVAPKGLYVPAWGNT